MDERTKRIKSGNGCLDLGEREREKKTGHKTSNTKSSIGEWALFLIVLRRPHSLPTPFSSSFILFHFTSSNSLACERERERERESKINKH